MVPPPPRLTALLLALLLLPLLSAPTTRAAPIPQPPSNDRARVSTRRAATHREAIAAAAPLLRPAGRNAAESSAENSGHGIGTLAAIFAGVLTGFVATFAVAYFFYRKERRKASHDRRAAAPPHTPGVAAAALPAAAAASPHTPLPPIPPLQLHHQAHHNLPHHHPLRAAGRGDGPLGGVAAHRGRSPTPYYLCGPASYGNFRNGSRLLMATVSADGASVRLESPRLADLSASRELLGSVAGTPRRTRGGRVVIPGGTGGGDMILGGSGDTGGASELGVARPPRPGYPPAGGDDRTAAVARQQRRRVRLVYRDCAPENGEACMICLEPLDGDPVVSGDCMHWTHEECLKGWLVKSVRKDCPACRRSLVCGLVDEEADGVSSGGSGGSGGGGGGGGGDDDDDDGGDEDR